ncbi:MAG: metal-dependent hydrolase [Bacteroidota bacterium]|jgi:L-ascorbate metabolism protein UlaG (beta-lactamase superfamily)
MNITYYGHSCFGVEINGKHLVFDPFITPNELAKNISLSSVKADYILISHGHEDHIADAEALAKLTGAKLICSWEINVWFASKGLTNIHPMNIGGKVKFDFGSVKAVAAVHSSGMPDGTYGGSPMGFVIESSEGDFYYAGDTALTYDMKLIGDYRKIDFAFLPIGDNFTMGVDNAIIACEFIKCNKVIGMHYDTFGYIVINKEEALKKFERSGIELKLMEIGQTLTI